MNLFKLLFITCLGFKVSEGVSDNINNEQANSLAKYMANLVAATYCNDDAALKAWTCGSSCKATEDIKLISTLYDSGLDIRGYIAQSKSLNSIVLAFRGASTKNWDLLLQPQLNDYNSTYAHFNVSQPNMTIHYGINEQFQQIRKHYLKALNTQFGNEVGKQKFIVAGHSLGGALATLAAVDLTHQYNTNQVQLVTFAQPRVGNQLFADYVQSRVSSIIRVTHGNDRIPTLPPSIIGYKHTARELYFNSNGLVGNLCSPSNGEDPTCILSQKTLAENDHYSIMGIQFNNQCDLSKTPVPSPFDDIKLDFTPSKSKANSGNSGSISSLAYDYRLALIPLVLSLLRFN